MAFTNSMSKIPVEIFATYIIEKLRRTHPHLQYSFNENSFVMKGAVVHIPNAGASPGVVRNRKNFPAAATKRDDIHVTYTLDVFSTDPVHVTWHEDAENSYSKTDSVLGDIVSTLVEELGDTMVYNWIRGFVPSGSDFVPETIPASNIIATTGDLVAANPDDGQTGERRMLLHTDVSKAQAMMNKMDVPRQGRYLMLESYMYQQLIDSLSSNQMAAFQRGADINNGVVGQLYGFNVMERSRVLAFAADGTSPLLPEDVMPADGKVGALAWHGNSVTTARGDIKPFANIDDPQYYGDIFSALVKFGGRCRRADWKGVLSIVQAAV